MYLPTHILKNRRPHIISYTLNLQISLVICFALKKECPTDFLRTHGHHPISLKALLSGGLNKSIYAQKGILFVITGVGKENSLSVSNWIKAHINPLFVMNIGTMGAAKLPLQKWHIITDLHHVNNPKIDLDDRLPILLPQEISRTIKKSSLETVKKPEFKSPLKPIDMEAYWQASVYQNSKTSFHCLKFTSDYADTMADSYYNKTLPHYLTSLKYLLAFINPPKKPTLAVIIPTYNRAAYLKRCIDSVLNQTHPADKIIVVDDGSNDKTAKLLAHYIAKREIILLNHKSNLGVSAARNTGIQAYKSDWYSFLDSDDEWTPTKLAHQYRYLQTYPFYRILQSEEKWIRNNKEISPKKHHRKPQGWGFIESLSRCLVTPSSVMIHQELLQLSGLFDTSLRACEDYDMWLRILRHSPIGLDHHKTLIKYAGHSDQLSTTYPAMDQFRLYSLKNMLRLETCPFFKAKIKNILQIKSTIFNTGRTKRILLAQQKKTS